MAETPEVEVSGTLTLCCHSTSQSEESTGFAPTVRPAIEDLHSLVTVTDEELAYHRQFLPLFYGDFGIIQPLAHLDIFDEDENDEASLEVKQFLFEQGPFQEAECQVCLTEVKMCARACCSQMICDDCMMRYLTEKIQSGLVFSECPASGCTQPVTRDEIISRITDEVILEKYHRFVTNANADPTKKTCPSCCAVTTLDDKSPSKYGHKITCEHCSLSWCFECHSPSHENVKCKENLKGLKALLSWSKNVSNGQRNARKCPKCKFLIQRSGGCDHMKCTRCKTHFCYACGGRQLKARFLFGNHYDRLSVFGCPRNFMNGRKKHLRRFVRGTIFSGRLAVGVVGSAVLVGLLPVAAVVAVFAGPAIGFVRLHRYLKVKKANRRARWISEHNANIVKSYGRGRCRRVLEPRRELDDIEFDIEILRRIGAAERSPDLIFARRASAAPAGRASADSSSLSGSDSSTAADVQSLASCDQQVHIAEKDETTSL